MAKFGRRSLITGVAATSLSALLPPALSAAAPAALPGDRVTGPRVDLGNDKIKLEWNRGSDGWRLGRVRMRAGQGWRELPNPLGEYRVLSSLGSEPPARSDVAAERAGTLTSLFPADAMRTPGTVLFESRESIGRLAARWTLDSEHPADVLVEVTFTPAQSGWYSVASPTVASIEESQLAWGFIPGGWAGSDIQPDLGLATKYGQGLPAVPAVCFDNVVTTLSSTLQTTSGITMAAIAEPGQDRDPFQGDQMTTTDVRLAFSTRDRAGRLTPQIYRPVLGGSESFVSAGQSLTFKVRLVLTEQDWWQVHQHAINDIYRFPQFLALKTSSESLTSRMARIQATYIDDPDLSQWVLDDYNGLTIGAQRYNGFVKEADGDAMKNSDIGAMWAIAAATGDPIVVNERLPYVRNFKLAQQQVEPGHYQGANLGQYYLYKSDRFVEEGQRSGNIPNYVEPLALTYYTILDMCQILLFEPEDQELRARVRLAADKLLEIQHDDGSWDVATNRDAPYSLTFGYLTDYRPTWYGLLAAHRLLGDGRYLDGARRGADWYVTNAVAKGHYLGSTGDSVFEVDLSVSQGIQGLLDLAEATDEKRYREAAVDVARFYTGAVYTHPIPDRELKRLPNGATVQDWQISQVGLQKEHSGSASVLGPILLNSHIATFIRIHEETGDKVFLDMARAAAIGRDAFVDKPSGVTSYYWATFDRGIGAFPHHSWWQVGWMLDYLLAEAHLRSKGKVQFPRGFFTPKVGGQQSYGFAPGKIYGEEATLRFPPGLLRTDNPQVEVLGALSTSRDALLVVLLNQDDERSTTTVQVDSSKIDPDGERAIVGLRPIAGEIRKTDPAAGTFTAELRPWGLTVVEVTYR